jgi:16S rRNA C967 or C1407 C5-methylase (RsmB/RsmF family)
LEATVTPGAYSFEIPDAAKQFCAVEHVQESTVFVEAGGGGCSLPLSPFFFTDAASVIAAHSLYPDREDKVLDMCAAPGGKALVVASDMFAKAFPKLADDHSFDVPGCLVCNEVSKERAARMQAAMEDFLPPHLFDATRRFGPHVIFTAADASTPSNTMERHGPYDKILLDAPGNVDRHLATDGRVDGWSKGTVKVSAEKQLKLLQKALWLLKEGGTLLYCTSALHVEECDAVVERLLLKTRNSFQLEVMPLDEATLRMVPHLGAESTDWGTRILPDTSGCGPSISAACS